MTSQDRASSTKMSSDEFFLKYDELITESIERYHVPGVSIAVVHRDSTYSKVSRLLPVLSHSESLKGLWNRKISQSKRQAEYDLQRCKHDESLRLIRSLLAS